MPRKLVAAGPSASQVDLLLAAAAAAADHGRLHPLRLIQDRRQETSASRAAVRAGKHLDRTLQAIRQLAKRAGVSLNPSTPGNVIEYLLDRIDLVLLMSVNPGFGGQIPSAVEKVRRVKAMLGGRNNHVEIDGGVSGDTAPLITAAGADVLVAGLALFTRGTAPHIRTSRQSAAPRGPLEQTQPPNLASEKVSAKVRR